MSRSAADDWLAGRGWRAFPFQRQVWKAMAAGQSGVLHATTGAGKTYAVWLGALLSLASEAARSSASRSRVRSANAPASSRPAPAPPLTVLWVTPMRALASDTLRALVDPMTAMAPHWTAGLRTGDTEAAERRRQDRRLPTVLVTTPESLSLLLARADAKSVLGTVRLVVADEWHELLGNKRGVQLQLALARLRRWQPALGVWGLSATLGNLPDAMRVLLGVSRAADGVLVRGAQAKQLTIDTLLPERLNRFPWGGHLGLTMLPQVVDELEASGTTLVFTNTRSQAEIWYQALLDRRPDWAGLLALHHGSLDRAQRDWVEAGLKDGRLKAVVCTSSLDLGVDFLPVERVLQIGSARGVARLLQRAGRSGHAPGRAARITMVPTQSLEIVEAVAARQAVALGRIESRAAPRLSVDVLVQHLVTVALGGGFEPDALYEEIRDTDAYADLSPAAWQWALDFVQRGGPALVAYPNFRRVQPDDDGVWRVPDARLARRHRANIGTIVSDASMNVQFIGGQRIGSVEEQFVSRLRPGDAFLFGGRLLELVRLHEMTAWVRRATGHRAAVPRWNGGRMPLSSTLADQMLEQFALADGGEIRSPELRHVRPLLDLQRRWSALPRPERLLAETLRSRDGYHLFLYPFAGRNANLGLASLLAWRAARLRPATFSIAVNDYGFELLTAEDPDWASRLPGLLITDGEADGEAAMRDTLLAEVLASLNAGEMAQRRFREIARISGLISQTYPGEVRSSRQVQASSSMYWEVFRRFDPDNQLLAQAQAELLAQELSIDQLQQGLRRMTSQQLSMHALSRPTPLAFALMVERFREKLSSESLADRIARMVAALEEAASVDAPPSRRRRSDATNEPAVAAPDAASVERTLIFGTANDLPPPVRRARRPRKADVGAEAANDAGADAPGRIERVRPARRGRPRPDGRPGTGRRHR